MRAFPKELARWVKHGGGCVKQIAHRARLSKETVYAAMNGRFTKETLFKLLPLMPRKHQARCGAEEGLLIQPLVDNGASIPEAAARTSEWTTEFVEAMADGRIDCNERARLLDKAMVVIATLSGAVRREANRA